MGTESASLRAFREAHAEFVTAFNEGDFERAFAGIREDFEMEWEFQRRLPGLHHESVRGRDAVIAWYREFVEELPDWQIEPQEYLQAGPRKFVIGWRGSGTGRASGISANDRFWDVLELDDEGRPRRNRQFFERDQALAAAGLDADRDRV